jgi:hypothetical protein
MDMDGVVIHDDRPIPTGVTCREGVGRFPYQPGRTVESNADLEV